MKKLYFKEKFFKITDHYPILDENGIAAYYLDQDFTFLGYRSKVTDNDGKKIFDIDRQIISFLPRYSVSFADGKSMVIEKKIYFFRKKVDVHMEDETLRLEGDIMSYNFAVYNHNEDLIGSMNRKFLSMTDNYELAIHNEAYEEELVALIICLNNMIDVEKGASS